MKHREQIINILKRNKREFTASDLAEMAEINPKNLSKYTKPLVAAGEIIERPEQQGKRRIKHYSIAPEDPLEPEIERDEINQNTLNQKIAEFQESEEEIDPIDVSPQKLLPDLEEVPQALEESTVETIENNLNNGEPEIKHFTKIDLNKVLKKLRSMSTKENPAYSWIIQRVKYRKHPIDEMVNFLNEFWEEVNQ